MAMTLRIEALPGVSEYQAAHDPSGIHLKIVPRPEANRDELRAALADGITTAIEALGAVSPPVDITFVDTVERQRQRMGKIKLIGASGGSKPQ